MIDFWTYDCEVFAHDYIVVLKSSKTGEYKVYHNHPDAAEAFTDDQVVYIGFNTKAYDMFIIKAIAGGLIPEEVKAVNDKIIEGHRGWDIEALQNIRFRFNNADITDDMQVGQSLKAIEGHLFMNIQETEVDFDLDRPLNDEELNRTIHYCKADVDATEQIIKLRMPYLENKILVGGMAGLTPVQSLALTNARLTAAILQAEPKEHDDERDYKVPDDLLRQYVPQEVFDFYARLQDKSIEDENVFKANLKFSIGACPVTLGFGGIHGAIPNYVFRGEEVLPGADHT